MDQVDQAYSPVGNCRLKSSHGAPYAGVTIAERRYSDSHCFGAAPYRRVVPSSMSISRGIQGRWKATLKGTMRYARQALTERSGEAGHDLGEA
jgi:hypothetical protein